MSGVDFARFFEDHGLPRPKLEYKFDPARKWRFDAAWPDHLIALEVEGGRWSGGRHTSPEGYHRDLEKYNAAAIAGWRILKITPAFAGTLVPIDLVRRAMAGLRFEGTSGATSFDHSDPRLFQK